MSAWRSSGWYQVAWLRSAAAHGPRAIPLMVCTATLRSRQIAVTSSKAWR